MAIENVDKKSLETEVSIAICRLNGDKWQSKTLFLAIYDPRWSIVSSVFDCRLSGVVQQMCDFRVYDKFNVYRTLFCFCLLDLILYVPSTIFQLNRDGYSRVEPVLS